MRQKSHYEVLGAGRNETIEEIAAKYRRLAMQWHPDRYPNASASEKAAAEERFKDISVAKKILSDPITRAAYDAFLDSSAEAEMTETSEPFMQEASMSRDEAQQMHFADLAAFALTLAAKAWNVRAIADHLMELGCSPTMANALAQSALDRGDWAGTATATGANEALASLDHATWQMAAPYYRAFIAGSRTTQNEFTDRDIERVDALRKKFRKIAAAAAGTFSLVGLGYAMLKGANAGTLAVSLLSLTVCSLVFGFVGGSIASLFIQDRARYLGEKSIRFYLRHFERFHTKNSAPLKDAFGDASSLFLVGPIFWLAYRRMPGLCAAFTFVWAIVVLILDHILEAMAVPARIQWLPFFAINAAFMTLTPRLYYLVARRRIQSLIVDSGQDLPRRIARAGGTNRWSWVPAIAFFICLMAVGDVLMQSKPDSAVASQQGQLQAKGAMTEAAAIVDSAASTSQPTNRLEVDARSRYAEIVRNLEAKYPRLNPDSPQYDARFVASVLQRRETLIASGMSAENALVLAANDVAATIDTVASQPGSPNAHRRSEALSDDRSTRLTHTTSEQNQQIICDSFPSSCRN